MAYRDYLPSLAPGWFSAPGSLSRRWLEAHGELLDAEVARLKEGVKASFPDLAPSDGLPLIGDDLQIDRGPGESEAGYRERLLGAHDVWAWAGTAYGVLLALWWAGYRPAAGRVVLQTQGDPVAGGRQYTLREDFDPGLHAPEEAVIVASIGATSVGGVPTLWSDFACLFVPPLPPTWLPNPPADGSAEVERIRRLLRAWKPAHARCVRLMAAPVELWDYPTPVEAWDPTAEPWDEGGGITYWTPPAG